MEKKRTMILVVVVLVFMIFTLSLYFLGVTPGYIARVIHVGGGNMTSINISHTTAPTTWQGLYGSMTSAVVPNSTNPPGGAIASFNIYSECPDNQTGEVYFSTVDPIDFASLVPAAASDIDTFLGVNPADKTSGTNVFTAMAVFEIYDSNMSLPSVTTNSGTGTYRTGILKQGSDIIFVANIQQDGQSFQGSTIDYQALIPIPGGVTYYTFIDPANTCPAICGNGMCEYGEDQYSCPADCGLPPYCGDGTCDMNETQFDCPADCGFPPFCGDGTCNINETQFDCPADCAPTWYCGDLICNTNESSYDCPADCGLPPSCGDSTCDANETQYNCPDDCGAPPGCGDATCDANETQYNCPDDCGLPPSCGDNVCGTGESSYNCPQDCGAPAICGDGLCTAGKETCNSCFLDCGFCPTDFGQHAGEYIQPGIIAPPVDPLIQPNANPISKIDRSYYVSGLSQKKLVIYPSTIDLTIPAGGLQTMQLRFLNTYSSSFVLTGHQDGDISSFTSIRPVIINVPGASDATALATFAVSQKTLPGLYTGRLMFLDNQAKPRGTVPVNIKVTPTNKLFSFELKVLDTKIHPSDSLPIEVKIKNVPGKNVYFYFDVLDPFSQQELNSYSDSTIVDGEFSKVIMLPTSKELMTGRYFVTGEAYYLNDANTRVTTSDNIYFNIVPTRIVQYVMLPLWILLSVILVLGLRYLFYSTDLIIKHKKTAALIYFNQLDRNNAALQKINPKKPHANLVLFVESKEFFKRKIESLDKLEQHKTYKRTILFIVKMRDFAKQLAAEGYDVQYYKTDHFTDAVTEFVHDNQVKKLFIQHEHETEVQKLTKELLQTIPTNIEILGR